MADWCPTMAGTMQAWKPQYKLKDEWYSVPVNDRAPGSVVVPFPKLGGGVLSAIGLYSYEQAMAFAWWYAAYAAAKGHRIEVRVQEYELVYDIKARQIELEGECG